MRNALHMRSNIGNDNSRPHSARPPPSATFSPNHARRGDERDAYSFISGIAYVLLSSYFGLVAPIRSIVNKPTLAPIVLFAGFMLLEKCFRLLPSRHYVAVVFGLFPSTCGETSSITALVTLSLLDVKTCEYVIMRSGKKCCPSTGGTTTTTVQTLLRSTTCLMPL